MQFLMKVQMEPPLFNDAVRNGSVGPKLMQILQTLKPKAVYFTAENGCRGCTLAVDLDSATQMPTYAEPFFLYFDAKVEFLPYMTAEDLGNAGLDKIAGTWS